MAAAVQAKVKKFVLVTSIGTDDPLFPLNLLFGVSCNVFPYRHWCHSLLCCAIHVLCRNLQKTGFRLAQTCSDAVHLALIVLHHVAHSQRKACT